MLPHHIDALRCLRRTHRWDPPMEQVICGHANGVDIYAHAPDRFWSVAERAVA